MSHPSPETLPEAFIACQGPISDQAPCGEDLESDAEYIAIRQQCEPQLSGFAKQQENITDWHDIYERCLVLLQRSKDVNVMLWLGRAALHTQGLAGFAHSLWLIHYSLEHYWEGLYPELDEDDGDPTVRLNSLLLLSNPAGILQDLRQLPLIRSELAGDFILANVMNSDYLINDSAAIDQLKAILQPLESDNRDQLLEPLRDLANSYEAIQQSLVKQQAETFLNGLEDFTVTVQKLHYWVKTLTPELQQHSDNATPLPQHAPTAQATPLSSGDINHRDQALLAMDKIIEYFETHEPSSPLPLLLKRAKKVVDMNFADIVEELAPQGLEQLRTIAGIKPS